MTAAIVDTSVWIEYFRGDLGEPRRRQLRNLIDLERVFVTEIIGYELIVGTKTASETRQMKSYLSSVHTLRMDSADFDFLCEFGLALRKKGLLGTYTDVSIAYLAQKYMLPIFSLNKYFTRLAKSGVIDVL